VIAGRLLRGVGLLHDLRSLSLRSNRRRLLVLGSRNGQRRPLRVRSLLCLCGLLINLCRFHCLGSRCCLSLRPVDLASSVSLGGACRGLLDPDCCCCIPLLMCILGLLCLGRLLRGMCLPSLAVSHGLGSSRLGHLLLRNCRDVMLLLDCFCLLRLRHALSSRRLLRLVRSPRHGGTRSGLPAPRRCRKLRLSLLVSSLCLLRILLRCLGLLDLAVGKCLGSSSCCLLALGGRCRLCLVIAGRLLRGVGLLHDLRSLSLRSNRRRLLVLGSRNGQRRPLRVRSLLCLCGLLINLCRFHCLGSRCCLSLHPVDLARGVSLGGSCRSLLHPGS